MSAKLSGGNHPKSKPSSILDHFNKISHDICQLTIEFDRRDYDIVAPLISIGISNDNNKHKEFNSNHHWVRLKNGGNKKKKKKKMTGDGKLNDDEWR
eukprot:231374_1